MRTTDHLRSTISLAAGLLCVTALCACDSTRTPTSPAPTSSTSPPPVPTVPVAPTALRYQLSGRVTDEMGTRLAGVMVIVHYRPDRPNGGPSTPSSKCSWDGCSLNVLTDADGFFEVELNAESDPSVPGGFGYVYAWRDGYESDVQILPIGMTSITKNLRLPRVQTIDAGQSTAISVAVDSAHCFDPGGEVFVWTRRCGIVRVTTGAAGTLFVEARATGGGPAPSISFGGNYSGLTATTIPGIASVPVRPGTIVVSIGVPSGTAQKFDVFTSLR